MKQSTQNTRSYSWLIWMLVGSFLLLGWMGTGAMPTPQSGALSLSKGGSQSDEARVASQEVKRPPADEPLDKLEPVKEWFEENVSESRNAEQSSYTEYVTVADDTDTISLEIPREWDDIDIMVWEDKGESEGAKGKLVGHLISASRNLERFESSEPEAGVSLRVYAPRRVVPTKVTEDKQFEALLAEEKRGFSSRCRFEGEYDLKNNFYDADYEFFSTCGRAQQHVLVVNAQPRNQSYAVLLEIAVTSQADVEAAARILQSFQVLGSPPIPER